MAASLVVGLAGCRRAPAVQVLGESTRLPGRAPSPYESAIFDGSALKLRGARGETLAVQVRISDGRARLVSLELPRNAAEVEGFAVRSLEVKEPSSALFGTNTGRGFYPDILVPTSAPLNASDLAFFDVVILREAAPGSYSGTLEVGERKFPVELEVSEARIDLEPNPLVWVFYAPREVARQHGLPDGDSPELLAREAEYYELFRSHGALLASDLPPKRFTARRSFMRKVQYWPVAVDLTNDETIERDVTEFLRLFRGSGVTPFTIPVDEPRTPEQKERARHIGEVMGRAGGKRPHFLRAVTDRAHESYGDAFDLYFSPNNIPTVSEARRPLGERFWTYNGRPPQAGSLILDTDGVALRTWGWIAERYGIELWYAWEGLYFSDRYNRGGVTDVMIDPLTFDERSKGGEDWGNGDGLLAYPGALPSMRLKALRRGLQDRLLLRELAACGGAEAAARIVKQVMPRALAEAGDEIGWSLEEPTWEAARREVLDQIEATCHD